MNKASKSVILTEILESKILPLFYHDDYDMCKNIIRVCYNAGIRVFEFTNRGNHALAHFKRLKDELRDELPFLRLGVGTVYTVEGAMNFIEASADFIVQPICNGAVAQYCKAAGILWIPGVMTINEIYAATEQGAELVKIFPAGILGYDYIKALRGPMPNIKLMVTGGIHADPEEIKKWLSAGANVCGLGSQLFIGEPALITANILHLTSQLSDQDES